MRRFSDSRRLWRADLTARRRRVTGPFFSLRISLSKKDRPAGRYVGGLDGFVDCRLATTAATATAEAPEATHCSRSGVSGSNAPPVGIAGTAVEPATVDEASSVE